MIPLMRKWSQMRWPLTVAGGGPYSRSINSIIQRQTVIFPRSLTTIIGSQNIEHSTTQPVSQQKLQISTSPPSAMECQEIFDPRWAKWRTEIQQYMDVFPEILHTLTEVVKIEKGPIVAEWFRKVLLHNVPSSKPMYGMVAVFAYKSLIEREQVRADKLKLAYYLGWCVELLHAAMNISDDMMDQSTTRRGQLCWYKLEEVGPTVINDVIMIEAGIYEILKRNFRQLECYDELVELFRDATLKVARGQLLEYLTAKNNVNTFSVETFNTIVHYKTSCHTLYLPAACSLHLAGIKDRLSFHQCNAILVELAHFCQSLNDFLDCFGNPDETGKIGTDIEGNKCSWLAVECMLRANPEQKAIMEACYGKKDPQKVERVKQLYLELNLPVAFEKYEEEACNWVKMLIQQASNGIPQGVYYDLIEYCCESLKK
ncbi:farnesyl pyrophosphate synthase-like isoform X1 [Anastrepha ludens]|uniref:farnesyl pyrophosphate synthase-like isoform X1 n=2 Tax=Anastrepha ludens TaxID=28586 RepID=UPI0023B02585|nr:farnesyl pyrophosphate synthase-like isoform X1 [Anastrepha ludens]